MSAQVTLGFGAFFAVLAVIRLSDLLSGSSDSNLWSWLVVAVTVITAALAFWSGYESWKKEKQEKRQAP
ncbi:hypothetical protein [Kineosporia sp. NBRC 101731]|uniref:hypothetical protein n=1 Tax=Kineosporia sp. NBRC 101731 TaxID=3032199 RepID=UPI0024A4F36F|nr:hypothetical protein [Kineosporia sp. NBRC 101731]GLY33246.1 hypothetical protein Kisp02_66110 [Kineosporia sp. NBRC 101731]